MDQAYHYARDVARLDFASAAEHGGLLMTDDGWDAVQLVTESFNDAGTFSTFRAFEWNWPQAPNAHQIVVYRGSQGVRVPAQTHPHYSALIEALEDQPDVMLIPHPKFGKRPFEPGGIDERFARLYEFHSHWAAMGGPLSDQPQVYELGIDDALGTTLQYAWGNVSGLDNRVKRRHHVGVIASSDNHRQTPGFNAYTKVAEHEGSLAVVLAAANTRDDLWVAMHDRRTYGTTGSRICAHFIAADNVQTHWPGQGFIPVEPARTFIVQAAGTTPLEEVALVKFDPATSQFVEAAVTAAGFTGPAGITTDVSTFSGDGYTYEGAFTDTSALHAVEETLYYLRIKEQGVLTVDTGELRPGRVAITSPIWVAVTDRNDNGNPDGLDAGNGLCGPFSGDADHDDDTDFLDYAVFQECYGDDLLVDFCACEMDLDADGDVDEADYVDFAAAYDGPGGLGEGFDGGEGFSPPAAGPDEAGDVSAQSQPDPTPTPANATIELRLLGSGTAVTALAAHTTYEVHYATGDLTAVNYVAMFGVADSAEGGITAAAQATSGDWAGAPWFEFRYAEVEGVGPVQHGWTLPGFARYQVVESEFPAVASENAEDAVSPTAGPSVLLCTITTGEAGGLYLEIYLSLLDPPTDSCEDAYGVVLFDVIETE